MPANRPGLTPDEMQLLAKELKTMVQNGADPSVAWDVLATTTFAGVARDALDRGFKDWAFRRAGLVEGEEAAAPHPGARRTEDAAVEPQGQPAAVPPARKKGKRSAE